MREAGSRPPEVKIRFGLNSDSTVEGVDVGGIGVEVKMMGFTKEVRKRKNRHRNGMISHSCATDEVKRQTEAARY